MDILDKVLNIMGSSKKEFKDEYKQKMEEHQPKRVCFNCGTEGESGNKVKKKGGQLICKKCLRKARKLAKKMSRGGAI